MSTGSTRQATRGPRYRRRRPLPALILLVVLAVLSGFVWTRVFETAETVEMATRCNPPPATSGAKPPKAPSDMPAQTSVGTMLSREALDDVVPIPPQDVRVQVLNASGEPNQAGLVSQELHNLNFGNGGKPANDPVYPGLDLRCHAQIRFGTAGASAARTLSLIAPCAQLVRDGRSDATVDLALGSEFDGVKTTQEAHQVLQKLRNWGREHQPKVGDQQRAGPPSIDQELLTAARDVHC